MSEQIAAERVESRFISAPDGLLLHVRCYGSNLTPANLPVLCLPGLTRTEADFEPLALHLSADPAHPRRVFALDARGRGRSAYDPDWRNYNPAVELADVMAAMAALGLERAVFVGTSRGGILTMLLAAVRPDMIAGAILNDIGPVIDPAGLRRIRGYVGKLPRPRHHAEGATILRSTFGAQFPNLTEADWLAWAKRNWREEKDGLAGCYDPQLALTLEPAEPEQPIPELWAQFDALAPVPVMAVRGALSDILSAQTVAAMRARRPDLEMVEIADQGHAPLLAEPAILAGLAAFIASCDRQV